MLKMLITSTYNNIRSCNRPLNHDGSLITVEKAIAQGVITLEKTISEKCHSHARIIINDLELTTISIRCGHARGIKYS